jgi:hypothetical protein
VYDYSRLPPLDGLVVSSEHFIDSSIDVPYLMIYKPTPKAFDITSELEGSCGLDCVKRQYYSQGESLTITLIRFASSLQAQEHLVNSWFQTVPGIEPVEVYDEFVGIGDDLWAVQQRTTLTFAMVDGPIFMLLFNEIELPPGAADFDSPWYMGLLSCFGNIQIRFLRQASHDSIPAVIEEPSNCMMWY